VEAVFVSLHGDPDSEDNRKIVERAELMCERRAENEAQKPARNRKHLEVYFYDANSAAVWESSNPTLAKRQQPRAVDLGSSDRWER